MRVTTARSASRWKIALTKDRSRIASAPFARARGSWSSLWPDRVGRVSCPSWGRLGSLAAAGGGLFRGLAGGHFARRFGRGGRFAAGLLDALAQGVHQIDDLDVFRR